MTGRFEIVAADEEDSRDLAGLAQQVRLAQLVVDAVLPLDGSRTADGFPTPAAADRAALRAVAFAGVQRAMAEHRYTARPDTIEALTEGRIPPVEGP